jgi:large subunit ribosomal protein L37Ae
MAGSSKRFGVRYGRRIRALVEKVESELRKKQLCPYCQKLGKVKRLAKGIWECKNCSAKFAAKAYRIGE